ncbi:beta-ketoacyl synthase domain-containing protein [Fusarium denticulatum]|uniref:Beta-ketoacyl synthase domain-containing protein n=1 Tax=Fusarium denticulatum TaxID=48507 RepID=A0A8H5T7Z5_9HYPO|nr:beta-ketoacyl synthase domain-containing protein [Fusarium denticulatum]
MESSRASIVLSKSGGVTVQMVARIGENLSRIFTREVEPLQLMTEGDILFVADKSPGVRILDIGAGTGGTTDHVLERLRNAGGTSKVANCCFTDISPGFLAKAADCFSANALIMESKALNIENDHAEQAFSLESYDLIICANVPYATRSIQETLIHYKGLLNPGRCLEGERCQETSQKMRYTARM